MREESAGTATADSDLVADQMHFVLVAQRTGESQVFGVVHGHAGGTLDQRLDDQRGDALAVLFEESLQGRSRAARDIGGAFLIDRLPCVGRGHDMRATDQWCIGISEDGDVGDGQRTHRFAMVAAGQRDELGLLRAAMVAPVMEGHLQRDLGRRGAIGCVEAMSQCVAGECRETLRKLHHRLVREAGEHHVLELAELVGDGGVDARVAVAEKVDPPGADAVEVAVAVGVVKPEAVAAHHRHQWQRRGSLGRFGMVFHLGAGVPDCTQAAPQELGVVHRLGDSGGLVGEAINQCRVCGASLACSGNSGCTTSPSLFGYSGMPQSSQNS